MIQQFKGTDTQTGKLTYYKVENNVILEKYDDVNKVWLKASAIGFIQVPGDMVPAVTQSDKEALVNNLVASGLFKPKTEYITIGDEPQGGSGVVNLKTMMSAEDVSDIKKFLMFTPRSILFQFFMAKIYPNLPWDQYTKAEDGPLSNSKRVVDSVSGISYYKKSYQDMVWASFIDLFNEANLEYVNQNQLEPWDWESKKLDAYYVSQSSDSISAISDQIDAFRDVSLALNPQAKTIMEDYLTIPKLGDLGLEINRQNAIKELLKKGEYITAQAIVDAYRYAGETVIGETLTKPIPYDIVAQDGSGIVKAT